jgi:hypothetical protein
LEFFVFFLQIGRFCVGENGGQLESAA